jgi:hypothetical protein
VSLNLFEPAGIARRLKVHVHMSVRALRIPTMMRHISLGAVVCLFWATPTRADEELPFLGPDQLPAQAKRMGDTEIQVTGPTLEPVTILIANDPQVPSHHYKLRGKIKYENVEKIGADRCGYVEMWNHFPGGGMYFSRTLATAGPLARLEGTSDWRIIELPFQSEPGKLPDKLVVNVVLPGKGTVTLGSLTLMNCSIAGEWWSQRTSGLVGGIGGSVIGLIGGLVGLLAGLGTARQLVMRICAAIIVLGCGSLVVAVVALCLGQPWYVYYPFLLGGFISVVVFGFNVPTIRKRYDALEMRRMAAMDA